MASSLEQLAYLYTAIGQYLEAEKLYSRSLSILQGCLDLSHPDILNTLNKLAWIHLKCGCFPNRAFLLQPTYNHHLNEPGKIKDADEIYQKLAEEHEGSLGKEVSIAAGKWCSVWWADLLFPPRPLLSASNDRTHPMGTL